MLKQLLYIGILISFITQSCNRPTKNINNQADNFVDSLLSLMTLDEKIGQLVLYAGESEQTGPQIERQYEIAVKEGKAGAIFNVCGIDNIKKLQDLAVKNTRLRIPLIFGLDVIHGYKTIFPIPFAEACSWDIDIIEKSSRLAAMEACASGINWTFAPMLDLARDPRWGRVAEGSGEDPYLGAVIAKARVKGFQGNNLNDPLTLAACAKHFVAYGAAMGGRDYNTVDISDRTLYEIYLPPYKAAVDAGVATIMSSFNDLNGIPCSGNKNTLKNILLNELNFNGFVVSDYWAINELVNHGFALDQKNAAEIAINAGVDMDMEGGVYAHYLKDLITEGKVSMNDIENSVRKILMVKYKLGLFDDPYMYLNQSRMNEIVCSPALMEHALQAAKSSVVLLKNDLFKGEKLLPVSSTVKKIAVIGPLANNRIDMLGTWQALGDTTKVITIVESLQKQFPEATVKYAKGVDFSSNDKSDFANAKTLAMNSELVICCVGENRNQNGEAASRSDIGLPGVQLDLLKELHKTGKPVVVLLIAGRPLTIEWISENISTIVFTGHLGTMGGPAIAEILSGKTNPSGKLVMSFPRNTGQIPVFYNTKNTGRPARKEEFYTSKYLDVENEPLFPFGFGIGYSEFRYSNLLLNKTQISGNDTITITVDVTNTGNYDGFEIIQLYIRDLVASVTRPVKELKNFKKIFIKSGQKTQVTFFITANDLKFYNQNMNYIAEPGQFKVFVGPNSGDLLESTFELCK